MHTPERAKYPSLTVVEILNNFLRIKQQEKEELVDYLSRFKSERNVLYALCGKRILDGFSMKQTGYPLLGTEGANKEFRARKV